MSGCDAQRKRTRVEETTGGIYGQARAMQGLVTQSFEVPTTVLVFYYIHAKGHEAQPFRFDAPISPAEEMLSY